MKQPSHVTSSANLLEAIRRCGAIAAGKKKSANAIAKLLQPATAPSHALDGPAGTALTFSGVPLLLHDVRQDFVHNIYLLPQGSVLPLLDVCVRTYAADRSISAAEATARALRGDGTLRAEVARQAGLLARENAAVAKAYAELEQLEIDLPIVMAIQES